MQFRKKPVVIDAVQLTWANWADICDFVPTPWFVRGTWLDQDGNPIDTPRFARDDQPPNSDMGLILRTLESQEFVARGGDWIIKGVKGEFYSCKDDIFQATYEPVTVTEPTAVG